MMPAPLRGQWAKFVHRWKLGHWPSYGRRCWECEPLRPEERAIPQAVHQRIVDSLHRELPYL